MRKAALIVGLGVVLMAGRAEAGVGDWISNSWEYATTPVNCVVELGRDLIQVGGKFVVCFLSNMNRNPATLNRLVGS